MAIGKGQLQIVLPDNNSKARITLADVTYIQGGAVTPPSPPTADITLPDGGHIQARVISAIFSPHHPVTDPDRWMLPIGENAGAWYAASLHDITTGERNISPQFPNGRLHPGLDLNLDRSPWGDVERGMPVFAIARGEVVALDFHEKYRGCVIQRVEHEGAPLWVRYWHLSNTCLSLLEVGERVGHWDLLGHIGAYPDAGDHLHFDMCLDPFEPTWWFTKHPLRWVDPEEILRKHCVVEELEAMLRKGGEE